jgi:hypothetical protein
MNNNATVTSPFGSGAACSTLLETLSTAIRDHSEDLSAAFHAQNALQIARRQLASGPVDAEFKGEHTSHIRYMETQQSEVGSDVAQANTTKVALIGFLSPHVGNSDVASLICEYALGFFNQKRKNPTAPTQTPKGSLTPSRLTK